MVKNPIDFHPSPVLTPAIPANPRSKTRRRLLWEVRSHISDGRIARVLFTIRKDCMVLLHGFIKKTQRTPKANIDLARRRKRGQT